jgi:predicted  nucleic acid-binding Zn-ribbon protein
MPKVKQIPGHVHKYKRAKYKTGTYYYFCATAECSHKIEAKLTLGKLSLCWRCGEAFEMTARNYTQDKPHCGLCTKSRKTHEKKRDEKSLVDQVGIEIPGLTTPGSEFEDTRKDVFGRRTEDKSQAKVIGENIVTSLRERLAALSGTIEVQESRPNVPLSSHSHESIVEVEIDDLDEDPEL